MMSVTQELRLFPDKTAAAMEGEVRSLLGKNAFTGEIASTLTYEQRRKVLRCNMNVVEKYLPTLNETGNRAIDKVKTRLCVDGRGQDLSDYHVTEIESTSIFVVA